MGPFGAEAALSPRTRITPRAEYRGSWEEVGEEASGTLERVGSSLRFGADLRHTLTGSVAFALQAEGITGNVFRNLEEVGFSGFRFGAFLDLVGRRLTVRRGRALREDLRSNLQDDREAQRILFERRA